MLNTPIYDFAGVCRFYMGLAHEIKIVESPEFEAYVKNYVNENLMK